jgi:hypothetical protein
MFRRKRRGIRPEGIQNLSHLPAAMEISICRRWLEGRLSGTNSSAASTNQCGHSFPDEINEAT